MLRRAKRYLKSFLGRDLLVGAEVSVPSIRIGSDYGGWVIAPSDLGPNAVAYSIGVGEDISFDLDLIRRFNCHVHAFDPTPRSIEWIRKQSLPFHFQFHSVGIAWYDGLANFYPPKIASHVSHSLRPSQNREHTPISVEVRTLATIMKKLGHDYIDLLKMDVEGAEYEIISFITQERLQINQLLIEFHHRFPGIGVEQTRSALKSLSEAGYMIFAVSPSGEEYSFVHKQNLESILNRSEVSGPAS